MPDATAGGLSGGVAIVAEPKKKVKAVGRRVEKIKAQVHRKKVAMQRKAAMEAAMEEKRKAEIAMKQAELARQLERSNAKVDPVRQAIVDAAARRAARQDDVQRQETFVAYLSRGRTPPASESWVEHRQNSFRERHGRPPTEEELSMAPQLADEQEQLRVSRHDLAEAALAVVEAKRALLVREKKAAEKRLRKFHQERRREERDKERERRLQLYEDEDKPQPARTPSAGAGAARRPAPRSNPLYEELLERDREIRQLDRQRRGARNNEMAWPGHHWQRNLARIALAPDADVAADARDELESVGWNV